MKNLKNYLHKILLGGLFLAILLGFTSNMAVGAGQGTITVLPIKTFLGLTDAPHSYSGKAGKVVSVKSDETGLEFTSGGGGGSVGPGTINQIAYFDTTTSIASLTTVTYPSLSELSYLKGVTSAIQTQLNSKGTFTLPALTSGSVLFSNGSTIVQDNTNFHWDNTNKQLRIGAATGFDGSAQEALTVGGTTNNYFGQYIQNLSNGANSSTDMILGADNDGVGFTGHFIDTGISGSGTVPASQGIIKNVSVANGGTGYSVGNVLTITGGNADATVTVATAPGGIVATVTITNNGTGYAVSNNNAVTGGGGTGCLINITSLTDTTALTANTTYVYGSGGDLLLGTDGGIDGKIIKFIVGGLGTGNIRAMIDSAKFSTVNIDSTALRGIVAQQISSDTGSSRINLTKARGTTTTPTTIVSGDLLGNLAFWGYDGSNYLNSGSIQVTSSGTIASTRVPTSMSFMTATDATPSVLTTFLSADNKQVVTVPKTLLYTNNAITASGNAATVPVTSRLNTVTNNSAATLTITLTTSGATDGQLVMVRILDSSAVAQTITWVNTENSTVSCPTTSNGSTTLFLSVGLTYNNATSKWRCIASA